MRILVAPDSFKGSADAVSVANLIEKGIRKVFPGAEVTKIPIADGGEGTVEAVVLGGGGELREVPITGPLGEKRTARFGLLSGNRGVIEMAAASGLPLVPPDRRDPRVTTTYGTGELIRAALDAGCREFMVGIGGSATNDAGMGMAQALGYVFRDSSGSVLGFGGGEMEKLAVIDTSDRDSRLDKCEITVACDVDNPLFGEHGAAHVYGPQKGATPEIVEELDRGLKHFADVVREQMGRDISAEPGSGAAGGLGAGLMVFCGARLKSGINSIMDILRFDDRLNGIDLVITGEGEIDRQSAYGKVPVGISRRAKAKNIPVLAIVGGIGDGAEAVYAEGINSIVSTVCRAMSLEEAMANTPRLLEEAAERAMRIIDMAKKLE